MSKMRARALQAAKHQSSISLSVARPALDHAAQRGLQPVLLFGLRFDRRSETPRDESSM